MSISIERSVLISLLKRREALMNIASRHPVSGKETLEGKKAELEISASDISLSVSTCFQELSNLESKVRQAMARASAAKEKAVVASTLKLSFWRHNDKTKAIEALQEALKSMSESQLDQSDALKALLEYQRAISNAMQHMLLLGAANMASNRAVYIAIEAKMRNASCGELSEMARQEFKNTLLQLKQQQDFFAKQERIVALVKKQGKAIAGLKLAPTWLTIVAITSVVLTVILLLVLMTERGMLPVL